MSKRMLIRKLSIPALITAGASILVLLALMPVHDMQFKKHKEEFKSYITSFMNENTKYLKDVASRIKSVQPDPVLVNELQSEYMIDHQKSDQPKKYLWLASLDGNFLFGVPSDAFQKINNAFDKYQERIKSDDFYRGRNDFLTKLIDKTEIVDFTQFERSENAEREYYGDNWRFYNDRNDESLIQPAATTFSTPVYDGSGKLIGKLFMKVDDRVNVEKYFGEYRTGRNSFIQFLEGASATLLILSGIFLWFLLPTWVYVDAQERDVKTPGVWAFLTLTSLFFGLTIYLITRPDTLKSFTCPECKGELNGTRAYCPHCGFDLSNNFCQQCQYPIKPEWQYCPDCRAELKNKERKLIPASEAPAIDKDFS